MQEVTLLLHFIGLGLLVTTLVAGIFIDMQYRKAPDLRTKALVLKTGRSFGLLGPIGTLTMLVTGIGNMHAIGAGLFTLNWLSTKIALFAVAAILGGIIGAISRKRGALVHAMSLNDAGADPGTRLASFDRFIGVALPVMAVLLLSILYLSAAGRLGAD
jgi:hypothetical protein